MDRRRKKSVQARAAKKKLTRHEVRLMDRCIQWREKSSTFGQGSLLARLRALSQFIACNRLGFHLLCNITHTRAHKSQSIYLFRSAHI